MMFRMLEAGAALFMFSIYSFSSGTGLQVSGEALFSSIAMQIKNVYRITPSIATGVEARKVISRFKWQETTEPTTADAILVVVKTFALRFPLNASYTSLEELERDADGQMNITGQIVHLYLFIADRTGLNEIAHMSYEVGATIGSARLALEVASST